MTSFLSTVRSSLRGVYLQRVKKVVAKIVGLMYCWNEKAEVSDEFDERNTSKNNERREQRGNSTANTFVHAVASLNYRSTYHDLPLIVVLISVRRQGVQ